MKIDKEFRHLLTFMEKDPRVSSLLRYPNVRAVLENLQNQLLRCQQSLDEFLTVLASTIFLSTKFTDAVLGKTKQISKILVSR